jgi:hypothetical protein
MASLTYIGAGLDIIPIIVIPEVNEFIYIDSRPYTQYGHWRPKDTTISFYEKSFLPRLNKLMQNNNFTLTKQEEKYLEYENPANQVLKYHINTAFPHVSDPVRNDISKSEHLVLCGYDPHKSILQLMPHLKYIWMNQHTVYSANDFDSEEDKNNSTFRMLRSDPGSYQYRLMKEKTAYEYWEDMNIVPQIKENYDVCEMSSLLGVVDIERECLLCPG